MKQKTKDQIILMFALYFPFTKEEITEVLEEFNSVDVLIKGIEKSLDAEIGEISLMEACHE